MKMFFAIRKTLFFYELIPESFFGKPKIVPLWHHCENPPLEHVVFKSVYKSNTLSGLVNLFDSQELRLGFVF